MQPGRARAPRLEQRLVGAGGSAPGERVQGRAGEAFEIHVGAQHLIDHVVAERGFVDDDDRALIRPVARRIPGSPAAHQDREIGIGQHRVEIGAGIHRMVFGEIGVGGRAGFDHRHGVRFGKGDERVVGVEVGTGIFREHDREFGRRQHRCQLFDIGVGRHGARRRGRGAGIGRRGPVRHHVFDRHVQIGRALRAALRHLAGAHHHLVQRFRAGHLVGPFDDGIEDAVRPADERQVAVPLGAGILFGILAVGQRLTRHDQHGDIAHRGGMHAHRTLHQADTGMQQHGLHLAGGARVAERDADGQGLVPAIDIAGAGRFGLIGARQSFPHRRPFRARRADDVIDPQLAEGLHDRIAAVEIILHVSTPC